MPQPMRPIVGQGFYTDPRELESRQACAAKMALVALKWVSIETTLTHWFSWAVSEPKLEVADTYSLTLNKAFKAALTAIENLHLRLVVIRAAMQKRFNAAQAEEFELLAQELRTRAGERNTVVHSQWTFTERYPNDVLLRDEENDRWFRYTAADFENMVQRLEATEKKVVQFTMNWVDLTRLYPPPAPRAADPPPTS